MRRITKEEYIEVIHKFEKAEGKAQTGRIAEYMDVKPPSVTEMLGKLQDDGLVNYELYLGATLTEKGRAMADELMARHRVIADFLEIIGVERELAELDACQIEHQASAETMARLRKFVEYVQADEKWIDRYKESHSQ